jgi:hypothetical protein
MMRITPRKLAGVALLSMLLSIGVATVYAEDDIPPSPHFHVDVTTHEPSASGGGFDSILYVSVPHQRPFTPPRFNLLQSFVLQSIVLTQTGPDGTSTTSTLITCTLSASPAYPSRNTVSTCTGIFASRAIGFVYPGSNTGIYFSGFAPDSVGHWTFTFTVTGLYNNAPTAMTSSVKLDAKA